MSELLTTGELIDRLKVGEVAEAVKGMVKGWKVEKLPADDDFGERIVWKDVLGVDGKVVLLNENVINAKWRILPKYVSFDEAMKALMDRKTVRVWANGEKTTISLRMDDKGTLYAFFEHDCGDEKVRSAICLGDKYTIEE
jgi:hypothetical protein